MILSLTLRVVSPFLPYLMPYLLLPLPGQLPLSLLHLHPEKVQGLLSITQCTMSQRRIPSMDIAVAQQFLREHENAVLATWRRDGRLQMSPVTVGLDGAGRAIISSQETTAKVRNLRRDPRATLCVFVEAFRGLWVQIEGTAEIVTLPEAMEPLVDYYRRLAGEHPDWDDYRRAMTADRRALIRITIERAGPDRQG